MPRLWKDTIEAHRREVRDAVLDTTAALIDEHGLLGVTMSQIAERSGIGRATLYKYFPDVESILLAWHERQVALHLEYLAAVRSREAESPLAVVLEAYGLILHEYRGHRDTELAAILHRDEHVASAEDHLRGLLRELIEEAALAGEVRDDVTADELAGFCLHSLTAASTVSTKAAVRRLVTVTLDGLRLGQLAKGE